MPENCPFRSAEEGEERKRLTSSAVALQVVEVAHRLAEVRISRLHKAIGVGIGLHFTRWRRLLSLDSFGRRCLLGHFLLLTLAALDIGLERAALLIGERVEVELEHDFIAVLLALLHDGYDALELLGGQVLYGQAQLLPLRVGHRLQVPVHRLRLRGLLGLLRERRLLLDLRMLRCHPLVLLQLAHHLVEVRVDHVYRLQEVRVAAHALSEVLEHVAAVFQELEERDVVALLQPLVNQVEVYPILGESGVRLQWRVMRLENLRLLHLENFVQNHLARSVALRGLHCFLVGARV